jgi:hypothetical protein
MFAVISTVKAENTFGDFDIGTGFTATLAGLFAQLAIDTFAFGLADSPYRKSAYNPEKRP